MNDRYLSRGKRLDNGEWIEGYYLPAYYSSRYGRIAAIFYNDDVLCKTYRIPVDPSTVGQYTGKTVKTGRKIFEGDIVRTDKYGQDDGKGHNFAGADTFCVDFEDGGYCLRNKWRRFNLRPDVVIEVIGNIHDNPELGGGQDGN